MLDEAGWIMGRQWHQGERRKKLELDLLYNSDSVTEKPFLNICRANT